jgi:hypothetical protein
VRSLQAIRAKVRRRRYELSKHAVDQGILRDIRVAEVKEALPACGRLELTKR